MIQLVDQMLEEMLRAGVPLSRDVDVSFATPDRKWGATITTPTVNLFLWDIRRDLDRAESGFYDTVREDGSRKRSRPDPAVRFRYLATAWASEHRDEHQLLGAVLRCVLRTETIDAAYVPAVLGDVGEIELELAPGDPGNKEFWNSLDGQLKPGLDLTVTMDIPLDLELPVGPEITGIDVTVDQAREGGATPEDPEAARAARTVRLGRVRRGRTIVTSATEGPDQA